MLIDDLKALLGKRASDVFIETFGGQKIWIPAFSSKFYPGTYRRKIAAAIGKTSTLKLSRAYGGAWMQVPTGGQFNTQNARRKIAEMQRTGASINEMVKISGRSRRTIYRWLNLPHAKVYGERNGRND